MSSPVPDPGEDFCYYCGRRRSSSALCHSAPDPEVRLHFSAPDPSISVPSQFEHPNSSEPTEPAGVPELDPCHVNWLPNDCLSHMMYLASHLDAVLDQDEFINGWDVPESVKVTEGPWLFTNICHPWKDVALSNSILWSFFDIRSFGRIQKPFIDLYPARSRNVPLRVAIVIKGVENEGVTGAAFHFLLSTSARWENVKLNLLCRFL
jgi:hypothetical protein